MEQDINLILRNVKYLFFLINLSCIGGVLNIEVTHYIQQIVQIMDVCELAEFLVGTDDYEEIVDAKAIHLNLDLPHYYSKIKEPNCWFIINSPRPFGKHLSVCRINVIVVHPLTVYNKTFKNKCQFSQYDLHIFIYFNKNSISNLMENLNALNKIAWKLGIFL